MTVHWFSRAFWYVRLRYFRHDFTAGRTSLYGPENWNRCSNASHWVLSWKTRRADCAPFFPGNAMSGLFSAPAFAMIHSILSMPVHACSFLSPNSMALQGVQSYFSMISAGDTSRAAANFRTVNILAFRRFAFSEKIVACDKCALRPNSAVVQNFSCVSL